MSIEEIIKDLEHTIKYFEGCSDKFQRGRKYQAMRTLEQLRQYNVVGQSEQLVCPNCDGEGFSGKGTNEILPCLSCFGSGERAD